MWYNSHPTMDVNAYGKKVRVYAARKEKAGLQQLSLGKL